MNRALNFRAINFSLLFFFCTIASADPFIPAHFFSGNCSLVESGTGPNNKEIFKGKSSGKDNCVAHIPVKEFSTRFEHCAVGGVSIHYYTYPVECSVGYYDRERTIVSINAKMNGNGFCQFVCVENKN